MPKETVSSYGRKIDHTRDSKSKEVGLFLSKSHLANLQIPSWALTSFRKEHPAVPGGAAINAYHDNVKHVPYAKHSQLAEK
jgi:hypothetical protein